MSIAASEISCGTLHTRCSASRLSLQYHVSTVGSCATRRHLSQLSHDTQLLNAGSSLTSCTGLARLVAVNGSAPSRKCLGQLLVRDPGAAGHRPSGCSAAAIALATVAANFPVSVLSRSPTCKMEPAAAGETAEAAAGENPKPRAVDPLRRYGVVHLRGCFTEDEQHSLYRQIQPCIKGGNFLVSVGPPGGENRRDELHQLGDMLYARVIEQLSQLSGAFACIELSHDRPP